MQLTFQGKRVTGIHIALPSRGQHPAWSIVGGVRSTGTSIPSDTVWIPTERCTQLSSFQVMV